MLRASWYPHACNCEDRSDFVHGTNSSFFAFTRDINVFSSLPSAAIHVVALV